MATASASTRRRRVDGASDADLLTNKREEEETEKEGYSMIKLQSVSPSTFCECDTRVCVSAHARRYIEYIPDQRIERLHSIVIHPQEIVVHVVHVVDIICTLLRINW
jgi:hypothetical protein